MCFICHVTPQDYSVEMSCIYVGESSLQHVTTLKSLVIIGILIVKRKILHQKQECYKYVLPLKNWVVWVTSRQEKYLTSSKMYILRRSAQKSKKNFLLMTTFYNITLKGPYIKYAGGRGPEGFCGVMKYFRHILTGLEHKISKLTIKEI